MDEIKIILRSKTVFSENSEAKSLCKQKNYGEIVEDKVVYSLSEAFFLYETKRAVIYFQGKKISKKKIVKRFLKIDKRFDIKYLVFKDLRMRGYILKTALKFGADFRIYERGKKPGKGHAKWILFPVQETEILRWHEFSAKNRIAHSTKKRLLLGIVDDEKCISYYEITWLRP